MVCFRGSTELWLKKSSLTRTNSQSRIHSLLKLAQVMLKRERSQLDLKPLPKLEISLLRRAERLHIIPNSCQLQHLQVIVPGGVAVTFVMLSKSSLIETLRSVASLDTSNQGSRQQSLKLPSNLNSQCNQAEKDKKVKGWSEKLFRAKRQPLMRSRRMLKQWKTSRFKRKKIS